MNLVHHNQLNQQYQHYQKPGYNNQYCLREHGYWQLNNYYQQNQASLTHNQSLKHVLPEKPDLAAPPIKPTCNTDSDKSRLHNSPAWMAKPANFQEDKSSKKPRASVISARVLLISENAPNQRDMTLSVSDGLPASKLRLDDCDVHKVPCRFHLDSYDIMNTGNLLVHQWLVTKYPKIVDSYENVYDANPFRPTLFPGTLDTDYMEIFESGKRTTVVAYKTWCVKVDGNPVKVSFG